MNSAPLFPNVGCLIHKAGLLFGLFLLALLPASIGHAEVVLDTGYSTNSYTTIGNGAPGNFGSKAVSFEATQSFNEFTTLSFGLFGGPLYAPGAGNVAINLYSSTGSPAAGAIPNSLLTTLATIPIQNFNGSQLGSFWTGTNLSSGSRSAGWYWLVVDTSAVSANAGELNWAVGVQGGDANKGAYFDTFSDPQVWIQTSLFSGYAEIAAVPEPSTYAMALAGLTCVGYLVRRRKEP